MPLPSHHANSTVLLVYKATKYMTQVRTIGAEIECLQYLASKHFVFQLVYTEMKILWLLRHLFETFKKKKHEQTTTGLYSICDFSFKCSRHCFR